MGGIHSNLFPYLRENMSNMLTKKFLKSFSKTFSWAKINTILLVFHVFFSQCSVYTLVLEGSAVQITVKSFIHAIFWNNKKKVAARLFMRKKSDCEEFGPVTNTIWRRS